MEREVIQEVIKKIHGVAETIKVTGTATDTKFEAVDADKTVIIKAALKTPEPELLGECGLSQLSTLASCLNHAQFKTTDATMTLVRKTRDGKEAVEAIEFKDAAGYGATYRTMAANLVGEQVAVADIKWDVSFTPTKSKVQEFTALAGFMSEFDQFFSVKTQDGKLIATFGEEGSSTNHGAMVLVDEIVGDLRAGLLWPIAQFQSILKMGDGADYTVGISGRGALQVEVSTENATYRYIMPARRR